MRLWLISALLIGGLGITNPGAAMSKTPSYICSPMEGTLIGDDGQPAAGVTITREGGYRGKSGSDAAVTDASGQFSFSGIEARRGLMDLLPSETVVSQFYYAEVTSDGVEILRLVSRDVSLNHETEGAPFRVRCDLGATPGSDGLHFGVCTLE